MAGPAFLLYDEVQQPTDALAQKLRATVYGSPLLNRASFLEDHPLSSGPLGMSVETSGDRLDGHDLVVVIGAEVFRYYPYVPGPYLSDSTEFLPITGNPAAAAAALMGDSLLGDPGRRSSNYRTWAPGGAARTAPAPMARPRVLSQAPNSPPTPLRSTPS
ncbi:MULTISPECIES: hypothetical protein [Streptomyces]|uniref:hypothetical protein n=1 Tax=Streptomyces TaxID=1883 RepID=UPI0001853259|nr:MULTISPECIES: hypothetical protein [Streptomyces]